MPKFSRTFAAGKMNKVVDERILPEGEYIDAMNIRMGSTENAEIGVIENTKGNIALTKLAYPDRGSELSIYAKCIGAYEDSATETIYWFVHDSDFPDGDTGKLDLIVSFDTNANTLTYHVVSIDDGSGVTTTLNFNDKYLITGVNLIGDLLFFTDNYNPPRFINVKRKYPLPVSYIDEITHESLLVIKKPPTESPEVEPFVTSGQENFLETRFISFAYRYKYIDGEYSATSQWSQIAFVPNPFSFSQNSMLNEGMTNFCNTANITYNSGGPLVIGIDLLFKQSNDNIIKVIEKLDKEMLGLVDDTLYTYQFDSSKIFTILPSSELLRLYDNVPLLAQAQTIMGNRLMYGNYVEGYDMIDKYGNPVMLEYFTNLITEPIGSKSIDTSLASGSYNIDGPQTIPNSVFYIDLTGIPLVENSAIEVDIRLDHQSFSGDTPFPAETTDNIQLTFSFFLNRDYTSVYDLATSVEFQTAVGTAANIKPVYSAVPGTETSCDGITFTDNINCNLPNNLNALTKVDSGISGVGQGVSIITSPASQQIGLQLIAMKYVDDPAAPTQSVYEYYQINYADATYTEIATPQSLHSNRDYEVGIVYMDEYNRSTTALVSLNNTEHIPCGYSASKNSIQVVIPPTQIAPSWAKRYKFVIKPDAENYEVIYTNLFFEDPDTNEVWFYLEGENIRKVETGDRLIVKADTAGPLQNCAYATVLLKESKPAGFITPATNVSVPAGVYIKMNPNEFSAVVDPDALIAPGTKTECAPKGGNYTYLSYPMNIYRGAGFDPANPGWEYEDYSIPAGSRIKFYVDWNRLGVGARCEQRGYILDKNYTSSSSYDNMYEWFIGENIELTLDTGVSRDGSTKPEFIPSLGIMNTYNFDIVYLQFYRDTGTNKLVLQFSTGKSCTGTGYPNSRQYCVGADIQVFRAIDNIIFETLPTDALPDIFYENNLSFAIDEDGNHMGNVQNQDIANNTPAIIDTKFFNCFSFGNGAESYKVRDSIIGRSFNLGERVTSVSAQDYKRAERFADITYSGVYNQESNLNKLNEFNLGLLNYKNLEVSFGNIYILDGRETDVLVLQEDKISYVLAGKNLLSDSTGGGAISSVPEVLGTQIARVEKYGISFNPESYVQWGANRYFTDSKRGAVLQLFGDSYSSDQLRVISESGMRTWFRDLFNSSFRTQKLGGFDPYMNEYVLSSNDIEKPFKEECVECGIYQTFTLLNEGKDPKIFRYCIDLGHIIGDTKVTWNPVSNTSNMSFNITVTYNGDQYTSSPTNDPGDFTFYKDSINETIAYVEVEYVSEELILDLIIDCPIGEELTIVEVVLTNNFDSGKTTHIGYRYNSGTYISPIQSRFVAFINSPTPPTVSRYNIVTGFVGDGAFPPEGSDMSLYSNKIPPDTFTFNPLNDKFKYYRSNTLYPNTPTGILELVSLASNATPIVTPGADIYYADFTVPPSVDGNILYLIWDYREAVYTQLCYEEASAPDPKKDICCDCQPCTGDCVTVLITNLSDTDSAEVLFPNGDDLCGGGAGPFSIVLDPSESISHCVNFDSTSTPGLIFEVVSGLASVTVTSCSC